MNDASGTVGVDDRRAKWAQRQNKSRWRAYQDDCRHWQADADELEWMISAARSFAGSTQSRVVLKRNERAFLDQPVARLIEVQRQGGHYVRGYSGFSFRVAKGVRFNVGGSRGTYVPGAEDLKVTDEGAVTITNQRVVLQGTKNSREWTFGKLLGVANDPTRPLTLMHVSNRQKVSGIAYAASETVRFRFFLGLALAHHQDRVAGFLRELDNERTHHAAAAPIPPVLVEPTDAPNRAAATLGSLRTVYFGRSGWPRRARVAQGFVTVAITVIGLTTVAGRTSSHHAHTTAGSAPLSSTTTSATASSVDVAAVAPSTKRSTAQPHATHRKAASAHPASVPRQSTRARAAVAKPSTHAPAPRRTKAIVVPSTCGAPSNPWGYNFCGRGHFLTDPSPDVCSYFDCIGSFWNGSGYMTECNNGAFSMSGGRQGACSHHQGEGQAVYSG